MISMFKRGEAKVPLDKIPALAKALHVDPIHLFRMAVEQQWPALKDVIDGILSKLASDNETEIFLNKRRISVSNRIHRPWL